MFTTCSQTHHSVKNPSTFSAPTELRFEKERLTPEEITEENCCNLILPRPFHPKFAKLDFKDPMRCLAAAAHFLIRKKLFNSKCTQLHVAKDFAVAEKKLHLAVSGRKYDPGKKASKRKRTSDVKTPDPKPSTSQDKSASEQQPQDESIPEQQQDMPAAEQQQDKASDRYADVSIQRLWLSSQNFYNKRSQFCTKETEIQFTTKNQIYLINFVLFSHYRSKETQATF